MEPTEIIKYLEEQNDFSITPLLEDTRKTANDAIIQLLKKQIPMEPTKSKSAKPIKIGHLIIDEGIEVEHCPVCNRLLAFFPNYCPDCGQRISRQ